MPRGYNVTAWGGDFQVELAGVVRHHVRHFSRYRVKQTDGCTPDGRPGGIHDCTAHLLSRAARRCRNYHE